MTNSQIILLLQLIKNNSSEKALLDRGLRYSQIAALIRYVIDEGLVEKTQEGLQVTPLGVEKMSEDVISGRHRKDGGWISYLDDKRIDKLNIDDAFLPRLRDIRS